MIHKDRTYTVARYEDASTLADDLTQNGWTLCTGFRFGDWLFLNDAFGENGAQEYAVIHAPSGIQWESWTCSWMEADECERMIHGLDMLEAPFGGPVSLDGRIMAPRTGHRCGLCA